MRLAEWLDTWYALYVEPTTLAPSTKACYHRAVAAVPDQLGQVELSELTALDVLPWILDVAREHPRAAQLDRGMLIKALRIASKVGLCRAGILDAETCPKPVHAPRKALILNLEQLRAYMRVAASTEVAPVLMLCCCGLRRSEARGVRWDAVDLAAGTITIRGQRRGDALRPLKTSHSYRTLQLPEQLVQLLATWPRSISGWVCDATERRVYIVHDMIVRALRLPPVTLHGLRHSFATAAVMEGIPVKLLQGALGHGSYTITADLYADHLPTVSSVPNQVFLA